VAAEPAVFVIGGVVTGAELAFRGSLVAAGITAPLEARAEVLAGFFLGAYIRLSARWSRFGVATEHFTARNVMLVFVVLAAAPGPHTLQTRPRRGRSNDSSLAASELKWAACRTASGTFCPLAR
jgi:hypothetical protein